MYARLSIALGMLWLCALSNAAVQAGGPESGRKILTDRYGDPLPEGARLRLGTLRFRTAYGARLLLTFSQDGKTLVSADPEGHITHWDPFTGRQVRNLPMARNAMALSDNGRVLACLDGDAISVRDTATGNELRRIPAKPEHAVALSGDGSRLAAWVSDRNARQGQGDFSMVVWDVSNGSELVRIPGEEKGSHRWFALSADGKLVITQTAKDNAVCGWDVASGASRFRIQPEVGHWFFKVALDLQCVTLAVMENSEPTGTAIILRDLATNRLLRKIPVPWGLGVDFPAPKFSPSGRLVASAGDKKAIIWNAKTGDAIRTFNLLEPAVHTQIAFSRDDRLFACSAGAGLLQVWDIATGKATGEYPAPVTLVREMGFAPDGNALASTYALQSAVSVWNCTTGQGRTIAPDFDWLGGVSFSRDGKEIMAGSRRDHCLIAWDAETGGEIRRCSYPKSDLPRDELAISPERIDMIGSSPDGRIIYARSIAGIYLDAVKLHAWDAKSGKDLFHREVTPGPLGAGLDAASPDMRLVATGDGCLQEWSTGRTRVKLACPQPTRCSDLAFSESGELLAGIVYLQIGQQAAHMVSHRGIEVRVWEVATGNIVLSLPVPDSHLTHLALSPDGRALGVSNRDSLKLFDVPTGRELLQRKGFPTEASKLLFSPDGSTLASGFLDSTILLWDVAGATSRRHRALTPPELEACWTDLAGGNAAKAYAAATSLQDAGKDALALIGTRLHPAVAVPAEKIRKLIGDLDGNTFTLRERATNDLQSLNDFAEPALRQALKSNPSAEAATRISSLLEEPGKVWPGEKLRAVRCVQVLEAIGSPEAKPVLATLAAGAAAARETREAKAALERLAHRPKRTD